jgi:hypothetical protein
MVIVLMFAAIVGSVITGALFLPYGPGIALAIVPFGGSLLAAAVATVLVFRTLHHAHTCTVTRLSASSTS